MMGLFIDNERECRIIFSTISGLLMPSIKIGVFNKVAVECVKGHILLGSSSCLKCRKRKGYVWLRWV